MCGIGGCIAAAGETPPIDRLESLRDAIGHRGPDDSGIEIAGRVGLVHTRLAIVDPSERGHQPMRDPSGRWLITYNGEVFNHAELRDSLAGEGFEGHSDTETVLHSIAKWGEDAIPRFNGLFAFAALDTRDERLLLVRDRFGVKPLYLAEHDGAFWFASEIGALLAAGIPRRPDRRAIARAIDYSFVYGTHTVIEGVRRLAPGTLLSIDLSTGRRTERRWYDPARAVDPERQARLERHSYGELEDQVEAELRASVHRRLMADVPIGVMCSGGVDSSLVAALAREARPDIVAFNVATPGAGRKDEGPAATRAAEALGIDLATVEMTPSSWRRSFVESVRHFEYPLFNASAVAIAEVTGLARDRGVKALLTGEGADELAGGYWQTHRSAFIDFLPPRRRLGRMLESARLIGPRETGGALMQRIRRNAPPRPPRLIPGAGNGVGPEALEDALRAYGDHAPDRRRLEAELLHDLTQALPPLLNRMDKNAMQSSVELRLPFLDPSVVSLIVNLPLEARVTPRSKGIFREVARRHLPRAIAYRPKRYGMLFDPEWIRAAAPDSFLREGMLRDVLEVPNADWDRLVSDSREALAVRLWSGEVWCRVALENQSNEQVESELWPSGP